MKTHTHTVPNQEDPLIYYASSFLNRLSFLFFKNIFLKKSDFIYMHECEGVRPSGTGVTVNELPRRCWELTFDPDSPEKAASAQLLSHLSRPPEYFFPLCAVPPSGNSTPGFYSPVHEDQLLSPHSLDISSHRTSSPLYTSYLGDMSFSPPPSWYS